MKTILLLLPLSLFSQVGKHKHEYILSKTVGYYTEPAQYQNFYICKTCKKDSVGETTREKWHCYYPSLKYLLINDSTSKLLQKAALD